MIPIEFQVSELPKASPTLIEPVIGSANAAGASARAVAIANIAIAIFFPVPPGVAQAGICPDYISCRVGQSKEHALAVVEFLKVHLDSEPVSPHGQVRSLLRT